MNSGYEYRALHYLLLKWGDWQERHYLDDSMPTYAAFTSPYSSDVHAGHRILCAEMERSIWQINWHIQKLEQKHIDTLLLWYAVNMRRNGGFWTDREKASHFRIRLNSLQMRVTRARRALYRRIFGLRRLSIQNNNSLTCESVSQVSEGTYG